MEFYNRKNLKESHYFVTALFNIKRLMSLEINLKFYLNLCLKFSLFYKV